MKFNRRDLLKRLAIIPLVGLLVKKEPLPLLVFEESEDVTLWESVVQPQGPGIQVTVAYDGLPCPISTFDFLTRVLNLTDKEADRIIKYQMPMMERIRDGKISTEENRNTKST